MAAASDDPAEQVHRLVEREVHRREHHAERDGRPQPSPGELGALRPVEGQHGCDHDELTHRDDHERAHDRDDEPGERRAEVDRHLRAELCRGAREPAAAERGLGRLAVWSHQSTIRRRRLCRAAVT
jgi:hypothetical protein